MKLITVVGSAALLASISATSCPANKNKKLTTACYKANKNEPLCVNGQCAVCHAGQGYKCYPGRGLKKCCRYCPMAKGCPGEKYLTAKAQRYSSDRGNTCGNPAIKSGVYPELEAKYGKKSASGTSTFIVGGEDAIANSWPWQVSMRQYKANHKCGGSILNKNWVLTAAHCNINRMAWSVVTGDHRFGIDGKAFHFQHLKPTDEEGKFYHIAEVINHPDYFNKDTMKHRMKRKHTVLNDFSLVKTATPIEFSDKVSPICLPRATTTFTNTPCVVTGWGKVDGSARATSEWAPTVLQQAEIKAYDVATCTKFWGYGFGNKPKYHKDLQLCAGAKGISACNGDSGGPLVCKDYKGDQAWYLAGVVSFGKAGCPNDPGSSPTIFARVTSALDWIEKVTGVGSASGSSSGSSSDTSSFSLDDDVSVDVNVEANSGNTAATGGNQQSGTDDYDYYNYDETSDGNQNGSQENYEYYATTEAPQDYNYEDYDLDEDNHDGDNYGNNYGHHDEDEEEEENYECPECEEYPDYDSNHDGTYYDSNEGGNYYGY